MADADRVCPRRRPAHRQQPHRAHATSRGHRKNWLFAGRDDGARRLAILYMLVGSCEQAGLCDLWHYLRDVLHKLSQGWLHSRLDDLLPLSWQATQAS